MREHKLSRATSIVCISAMISFIVCSCTTPQTLTLHYDTPAQYFEEALPIGNGRLGAMVYSRGNEDVLTLNDITLWTGEPENNAQHIDMLTNPNVTPWGEAREYIDDIRDFQVNLNYFFTKAIVETNPLSYDIVTVYPNYFLDYQDKRNIVGDMRWINRVYSSSGDWSGNLLDFYFRINNYLVENVKIPFKLEGIFRVDITPMHKAIREVLCNCLANADYHETRGLVIKQYNHKLEFSNPGAFTMHKDLAYSGGNSDARNKLVLAMFNNINIGERTGSGIPLILKATKDAGYHTPTFQDFFNPDYTIVTIFLEQSLNVQENLGIINSNLNINANNLNIEINKLNIDKTIKELHIRSDIKDKLIKIYETFKDDIFSSSSIVDLLNCGRTSSDNYLKVLLANKLIEPIRGKGKGKYKFK